LTVTGGGITCITGGQPARNEGRNLLHASIASGCDGDRAPQGNTVDPEAARSSPDPIDAVLPKAADRSFHGKNAETKDVLLSCGLAAIAWLIVWRILHRIIRP